MLLKQHVMAKYAVELQMTEEDVDELIEDLEEWDITTTERFEKHLLFATRWFEGVGDEASARYAKLYSLDESKKYHDKISDLDYTNYLFFFHGDF